MFEQLDKAAWANLVGASGAANQIPELLQQLARAEKRGSVEVLHRLLDEIWVDGQVFPATAATIPFLCQLLDPPVTWLHPKILLVLGVLAEGAPLDADNHSAVHNQIESRLDLFLSLAPAARDDEALRLALGYLLAHFPSRADQVEAKLGTIHLHNDDRARIRRCLTTPDFTRPETFAHIGRSWPTPEIWKLKAEEDIVDRSWRQSLDLDATRAARIRELETKALLAFLGAHAEHAIKEVSDVA